MSIADNFEYLKAMKLGETESFLNDEPADVAPSQRAAYKRIVYIVAEINKQLGAAHFVVRSKDDAVIITRIFDGKDAIAIAPVTMEGKKHFKTGPRQKKATITPPEELRAYIDAAIAKATNTPAGQEYWIVRSAPYFAFKAKADAEALKKLLGNTLPLIHVREV